MNKNLKRNQNKKSLKHRKMESRCLTHYDKQNSHLTMIWIVFLLFRQNLKPKIKKIGLKKLKKKSRQFSNRQREYLQTLKTYLLWVKTLKFCIQKENKRSRRWRCKNLMILKLWLLIWNQSSINSQKMNFRCNCKICWQNWKITKNKAFRLT